MVEQDQIVDRLAVEHQDMTEEEYDELYGQLDAEHQGAVLDNARQFANNAVGTDDWDQD